MKLYTKVVIDIDSGDVVESESFEYNGPVAQCIGGGSDISRSQPVKVPIWNRQQQDVAKLLFGQLKGGMEKDYEAYPRDLYVPRTAEEADYFGRESTYASDLARMRMGLAGTEEDMNRRLASSAAGIGATQEELRGMRDKAGEAAFQITPETTEQYYQEGINF